MLHRFDKFAFDVTDLLQPHAQQSLMVAVYDPTEFGHIALGKQRLHPPRHPSSIWYTSNTGIWQTVWLEPVRMRRYRHSTTYAPGAGRARHPPGPHPRHRRQPPACDGACIRRNAPRRKRARRRDVQRDQGGHCRWDHQLAV